MKLSRNGVNLYHNLLEFVKNSSNLFIFTPYIKINTLTSILTTTINCRAIFVRWEAKDIIYGASDLEIYPYLKEQGITLYRNPRLHLKAFVDNYTSAFIGSANISQRALNHPETSNYNYELATTIDNLTIADRLYFNRIENESILITDHIYEQFKNQLPEKIKNFPNETDFNIKTESPDKDFLISSLPLTHSVATLFEIYLNQMRASEVELNCFIHDLALYQLPLELSIAEFKERLTSSFFCHPFIKAFLKNLDDEKEIYFGEAKAWIHEHCANVPLPRRWEITENIQILYRWIVFLGGGKYEMDRPNFSERLFKR